MFHSKIDIISPFLSDFNGFWIFIITFAFKINR